MFNQNWINLQLTYYLYFFSFSVQIQTTTGIFDRVIEQFLHEYGGQERCPWSRAIMEAELSMQTIHVLVLTLT